MSKIKYHHKPVLVKEVLSLVPLGGRVVVDFTLGLGGHSLEILEKYPNYRLIGFDRDQEALKLSSQRLQKFQERIVIKYASFDQACDYLRANRIKADFFLADLGVSSWQLSQEKRGFSFTKEGPLDMRMDDSKGETVANYLKWVSFAELKKTLQMYGEEPLAGKIARKIIDIRDKTPLENATQLTRLVSQAKLGFYKNKNKHKRRHHPATLTFQALRVYINDEINQLKTLLDNLISLVLPQSRLAVISFHSLEDRLVKQCFVNWSRSCVCDKNLPICVCRGKKLAHIIYKKPVVPTTEELNHNYQARSAKLRAVEFI